MRRRREPDNRLNWRDPDMPVLRPVEYGFGLMSKVVLEEFSPDEERAHAAEMLQVQMTNPNSPRWIDDPTYNLARKGARRRRQ